MRVEGTTYERHKPPAAGLGVLVGGRSSRMGGHPKGLLHVPGTTEPLVVHALRVGTLAGCSPCWLIGDVDAYDSLIVSGSNADPVVAAGADADSLVVSRVDASHFGGRLRDDPPHVGPLGGLRALLAAAVARDLPHVLAVACDMPYVSAALLTTLRQHPSEDAVVAARRGPAAPWEPLLARYRPALLLPVLDEALAEGVRSFQQLLQRVSVSEWDAPGLRRALEDWDCPADVV